jgi:predicted dehydrogenase
MNIGLVGITALYWPVAMAQGLAKHKKARLTAFATLGEHDKKTKALLGMTSTEYALKYRLKRYVDAHEMIKNQSLDAIIICTRHSEHAKWVKELAKYRINMHILKSFATTNAHARAMVRTAKKHGFKISSGPSARYLPLFAAAGRAVHAGRIGKPFSMRLCHHHGVIDVFNKKDWYRDKKEGGPELSLGWYVIDLALHFMGKGVKSVFAEYVNYTSRKSPFMDCGRIVLRFKNGSMAALDMYFCNRVPYPSWEMDILGPKGVISLKQQGMNPGKAQAKVFSSKACKILKPPARVPNWETAWVEDFVKNRRSALDGEYSALVTRISLAARKSAQSRRDIQL